MIHGEGCLPGCTYFQLFDAVCKSGSMESTFVLWIANKSDGGLGSIVELQFTQGKFTNLDRTTRLQYVELGPSSN